MDSNAIPYSSKKDIGFDDADLNDQNFVQNEGVPPNVEATEMYDMLNSTHQPLLWPGYKNTSNLSAAIAMLNLRSKHNMSQDCFNDVIKLMGESNHNGNVIPSMQPAKMSRKKKRAETHAPLIIPSNANNTKKTLQLF
ncbi:unnamed protein product [Lathyrus oleraceus]